MSCNAHFDFVYDASNHLQPAQALGCLLFFIAYGKLAFVGEAKLQVLNGDYSMPPRPQRPEALRQLLRCMLTVSPADRPDINTVLQHLGQLATNLNADKGPASPPPSRPITPAAPSAQQQHLQQQKQQQQQQPVSSNPADLVSAPLPSAVQPLPTRRASSGSLKGSFQTGAPGRSSSPAVGARTAPLSPTHPRQTGQSHTKSVAESQTLVGHATRLFLSCSIIVTALLAR